MPVEVAMPGCGGARLVVIALSLKRPGRFRRKASWRSGYAEDCKSLHPGSIPGEASRNLTFPHIAATLFRAHDGLARRASTALACTPKVPRSLRDTR